VIKYHAKKTVVTHINESGKHRIKFTEGKLGESGVWFPRNGQDPQRWIESIMVTNGVATRVVCVIKNEKVSPKGIERIDWKVIYDAA
jgi:hypothetical protein